LGVPVDAEHPRASRSAWAPKPASLIRMTAAARQRAGWPSQGGRAARAVPAESVFGAQGVSGI
jgi:hypothetical protein